MNLSKNQQNELLFIGFNQDNQCFVCGTDSGFAVYVCDPLKESLRREFPRGGIGIVEMLFKSNILALVGGGKNPRYDPRRVMIWDDHQAKCIGELSFRNEVKAVKLRRDRVVVVLEQKIYVYNFADLKLMHQIETIGNPKGLVALSPRETSIVLACPALHKGHVRVELYDQKKQSFITAHESELACLALNFEGTKLATASEKGTLIRIFDTCTATQIQELRRGWEKAKIYNVCFNAESTLLCASSDRGTVHVFALGNGEGDVCAVLNQASAPPARTLPQPPETTKPPENTKSSLSFMKNVLPKYFSSEWSFAQFHVGMDKVGAGRTICTFGSSPNTLIIIGADGRYCKVSFDLKVGKECKQEECAKFIRSELD